MRRAVLVALAAAALLVGAYVALGGGRGEEVARPPDACARARADAPPPGASGLDVERLALTALADAACRLRVSRERLLLAVGGVRPLPPGIDDARRDEAIRAALRGSIESEQRAGRITPDQAGLLRAGVDLLPISELVERLAGGAG